MAAIDSAAITRFRNSVAAALAISDKSAFDDATRALSLATRTPDVFSLPEVQADPQLSKLLSLAADLHWLQTPSRTATTWASILKQPYHQSTQPPQPSTADLSSPSPSSSSSRLVSLSNLTPTRDNPHVPHNNVTTPPLHWCHPGVATQPRFVPPIPSQPVALPIMVAPTAGGVRPSFRSWKWHRATPSSTIAPFGQQICSIAGTTAAAAAAASAVLSSGVFDKTWSQQSRPILGRVDRYASNNDSNEDLLSTMRMTPATQAAGVTTAAAFQALKPFLQPEQRKALRNSIAYAQPLHALDAVVESVHAFCEPLLAGEVNSSASTTAVSTVNQSAINLVDTSTHNVEAGCSSDVLQELWGTSIGNPMNPRGGGSDLLNSGHGNDGTSGSVELTAPVNGFAVPQGVGLDDDGPWSGTVWTPDRRDVFWKPLTGNLSETGDRIGSSLVNPSTSGSRLDVNATPFIAEGLMDKSVREFTDKDRLQR